MTSTLPFRSQARIADSSRTSYEKFNSRHQTSLCFMTATTDIEYFTEVYMKRARFVAMFISKRYAEKEWPRVEKRAALARALTERSEYVLPIRIDDTELSGMPPTVIYIEAVREGIPGIANGILHKLGEKRVKPTVPYHGKVAKTKEELRELIAQRTPVWEFVLYASVLYQGREELRPLIRDHSIGYAPWNGKRVTEVGAALQLVPDTLNDLIRFGHDFSRLLSPGRSRRCLRCLRRTG